VGVVGCRDQCQVGQGSVVAERVAFCQELLSLIGAQPERVKLCPLGSDDSSAWDLPAPMGVPPARHLAGAASRDRRFGADAILHLAQAHDGPSDIILADARSPFGVVDLDAGGCTACEACTSVCPTGALAADRGGDAVSITFDAALCSACGVCIPRCPEVDRGVLRLERAVDLGRLRTGRTVLYRDQAPRCFGCGAPVAPSGMMARLAELLGDQYAALAPTITRYCLDCRGAPQRPPRGGQRC
jgi:ferredoxin